MSTQTCTTGSTTSVTPEQIAATILEIMKELEFEALADYMRSKGFDPDCGGYLILPDCPEYRELLPVKPRYVRFSWLLSHPMMVMDTMKLF